MSSPRTWKWSLRNFRFLQSATTPAAVCYRNWRAPFPNPILRRWGYARRGRTDEETVQHLGRDRLTLPVGPLFRLRSSHSITSACWVDPLGLYDSTSSLSRLCLIASENLERDNCSWTETERTKAHSRLGSWGSRLRPHDGSPPSRSDVNPRSHSPASTGQLTIEVQITKPADSQSMDICQTWKPDGCRDDLIATPLNHPLRARTDIENEDTRRCSGKRGCARRSSGQKKRGKLANEVKTPRSSLKNELK